MGTDCCDREAQTLMLVATAIAAGLGAGRSIDDISVMSNFLNVIGDQLSLLATVRSRCLPDENPVCVSPAPKVGADKMRASPVAASRFFQS